MTSYRSVAFVGGGRLARILVEGWRSSEKRPDLVFVVPRQTRRGGESRSRLDIVSGGGLGLRLSGAPAGPASGQGVVGFGTAREAEVGRDRLNFSYGCYGCREATDIQPEEAILGFPGSLTPTLVAEVERLADKAVPRSGAKPAFSALMGPCDEGTGPIGPTRRGERF